MRAVQSTLDEVGTSLRDVTFVVVDLETTGGNPRQDEITEIGAVKVRGGEVLGEFATLVNPHTPIPAFITVLTGITQAMVAQAPRIDVALPAFLDFARGAVLVAHNARFDMSFLTAAAARAGRAWPDPTVVDTVHLARQLVSRDEAPNHRLATLARLFGATTTPDHRALHDARATVDVLHGLIARVGDQGVHTLEDLLSYSARVPSRLRRKRHLADALPDRPGVYLFTDAGGRVLYVGTSGSIRTRVRSYFTRAEKRRRMRDMVALAEGVTPIPCPTPLEAAVREVRLIAEHRPPYNRRSTRPERAVWVKITAERFPRLSIVASVRDDAGTYAGPFASRSAATAAVAALHDVVPVRQCTQSIPRRPTGSACLLAELDRCWAPCTGAVSPEQYSDVVETLRTILTSDPGPVVNRLSARMRELAATDRFEDAAAVRDRLEALLTGLRRSHRLAALTSCPHLVAARPGVRGGWDLVCVRHGRLVGSQQVPPGRDPRPAIEALVASAEVVPPPIPPAGACLPEESDLVLRWLEEPGTRMVQVDGQWASPISSAAGWSLSGRARPERASLLR